MRRFGPTAFGLLATVLAGCSGGNNRTGPALSFGVNSSIEWWGGELNEVNRRLRDFEAQRAPELGGLVRMAFRRGEIEKAPDQYDFAWHDNSVDSFRANGSQILGVLIGSVPWAVASPTPDISQLAFYPPDDPAEFGRYAGTVAAHFKGRVTIWEIWNEPNTVFFWSPAPDAARYARLLSAALTAIREADTSARIISGAPAPAPSIPPLFLSDADFLDAMFAAEASLANRLDGVAVHLYGDYPPQAPPEEIGANYRGRVRSLKTVLERHHASQLPLFATEFGFCSGGALDPDAHAAFLVRAAVLLAAEGVSTLVPWVMLDHGPQFRTFAAISAFECERTFGMFEGTDPASDPPAKGKPAATAWTELASALSGARFESDASAMFHDPTTRAFRFSRNAEEVLVAYRPEGASRLEAPLYLGNKKLTTGSVELEVGPMPVVLVYK